MRCGYDADVFNNSSTVEKQSAVKKSTCFIFKTRLKVDYLGAERATAWAACIFSIMGKYMGPMKDTIVDKMGMG